jgi:hypothetical protein
LRNSFSADLCLPNFLPSPTIPRRLSIFMTHLAFFPLSSSLHVAGALPESFQPRRLLLRRTDRAKYRVSEQRKRQHVDFLFFGEWIVYSDHSTFKVECVKALLHRTVWYKSVPWYCKYILRLHLGRKDTFTSCAVAAG